MINGESMSMVWPTLESKTAKEQNRCGCSVIFVCWNVQLFTDKSSKFGSLPACLRRAMMQKFPEFDQYQLGEWLVWLPG